MGFAEELAGLHPDNLTEKKSVNLDFSEALLRLKRGLKVRRKGWKHYFYLDIIGSYLRFVNHNQGAEYQWQPSSEDLLATDWEVVD